MPTWSANGADAAQLFRDLYFGKYPASTNVLVVHQDPCRPYRLYNKNGFYKHYKNVKERVETFKTFGTGLNNSKFKEKLRLHEAPTAEERGSNVEPRGSEESDEDDETYRTGLENEDVTLGGFEVESFLGLLSLDDDEVKGGKKGKRKSGEAEMVRVVSSFGNEIGLQILVQCPDGRLAGFVSLPSGFDGTFLISDDGKSVVQKTYCSKTFLEAKSIFYKLGLTEQDVHVVHMQAEIDRLVAKSKKSEAGRIFTEKVIFLLPYEVKGTFLDNNGIDDHRVSIGMNAEGVEWAYFFLVEKQKKCMSPEPRINRDRTRIRAPDDGNNNALNMPNGRRTVTGVVPVPSNNNGPLSNPTTTIYAGPPGMQFGPHGSPIGNNYIGQAPIGNTTNYNSMVAGTAPPNPPHIVNYSVNDNNLMSAVAAATAAGANAKQLAELLRPAYWSQPRARIEAISADRYGKSSPDGLGPPEDSFLAVGPMDGVVVETATIDDASSDSDL